MTGTILAILVELSGLEPPNIKPDTLLADIGIDSLLGMEVAHELEGKFKCNLLGDEWVEIESFADLTKCVQKATGSAAEATTEVEENTSEDEESSFPWSSEPGQ